MTIELALLAASVVLGVVHVIIVAHLQSWQRGYSWTAGAREQSVAPLTGLAGRAERALRNYLETFPFFAAAILVVTVTNTHSWLTVWGAHFYFWGRIVYAILYKRCRAVPEVTVASLAFTQVSIERIVHSATAALIPGVACSTGIFVITSSRAARMVWISSGL